MRRAACWGERRSGLGVVFVFISPRKKARDETGAKAHGSAGQQKFLACQELPAPGGRAGKVAHSRAGGDGGHGVEEGTGVFPEFVEVLL